MVYGLFNLMCLSWAFIVVIGLVSEHILKYKRDRKKNQSEIKAVEAQYEAQVTSLVAAPETKSVEPVEIHAKLLNPQTLALQRSIDTETTEELIARIEREVEQENAPRSPVPLATPKPNKYKHYGYENGTWSSNCNTCEKVENRSGGSLEPIATFVNCDCYNLGMQVIKPDEHYTERVWDLGTL